MNQTIYELLLPLKPKWEVYKNEHHSIFTNQDYAIVQQAWSLMFGAAPRNMGCQSCVQELLSRVFNQFDKFTPEKKRRRSAKV